MGLFLLQASTCTLLADLRSRQAVSGQLKIYVRVDRRSTFRAFSLLVDVTSHTEAFPE